MKTCYVQINNDKMYVTRVDDANGIIHVGGYPTYISHEEAVAVERSVFEQTMQRADKKVMQAFHRTDGAVEPIRLVRVESISIVRNF